MYYDELYHDTRYEIINRSVMIRTPLDSDIIFQDLKISALLHRIFDTFGT